MAGALALAATSRRVAAREKQARLISPPEGRLIRIGAQDLHVVEQGSGPDLVLIHGASGSSRDFTFDLVARLAPEFRVLAFDRPGFGYSTPLPTGEVSLAAQAQVLSQAAATLGATRPILLGHSYGGAVASRWAMDHPAAALIAVSAPALPWPGHLDPWYRITAAPGRRRLLVPLASAWVTPSYFERQIRAVFAPGPVPDGYIEHLGPDLTLRAGQLSVNVAQINALRDELVAMEPDWTGLSLPVELLHGTDDSIVPAQIHAEPLAPRLQHARLELIAGGGHTLHHSHPEHLVEAARRAATWAGLR